MRIALGEPVELHQLEQREHLLADLFVVRPRSARLDAQAECHILEHAHVTEQRIVLEYEADLALTHILVGRILAMKQNAARVGRLEPRDHAQQRGLATTGGSQQSDELAGGKRKVHAAKCGERTEALFDVPDFNAHAGPHWIARPALARASLSTPPAS